MISGIFMAIKCFLWKHLWYMYILCRYMYPMIWYRTSPVSIGKSSKNGPCSSIFNCQKVNIPCKCGSKSPYWLELHPKWYLSGFGMVLRSSCRGRFVFQTNPSNTNSCSTDVSRTKQPMTLDKATLAQSQYHWPVYLASTSRLNASATTAM
jgi:hypothetical protein